MAKFTDNSGVKNTCPKINEVISAIESVDWSDNWHNKDQLVEIMEELRASNLELREWGNYQNDRAERAEEEMESLKKQLESLIETI